MYMRSKYNCVLLSIRGISDSNKFSTDVSFNVLQQSHGSILQFYAAFPVDSGKEITVLGHTLDLISVRQVGQVGRHLTH